ncbi:MAG: hypothetical protein M1314_00415 [Firmicutes bacterium]|nr:hypothetical protein [Bacillota bacterium]
MAKSPFNPYRDGRDERQAGRQKKWRRRSDPIERNQPAVPWMKTGSPEGIR